jgi:hypothetical protein
MDIVLPHFAKQNEVKRCPFKIIVGGASRQMKSRGLFTQPQFSFAAEGRGILLKYPL